LPDDYWVFAEFSFDRNVDWFIIREVPEGQTDIQKSAIIATEFKRLQYPLYGTSINTPWQQRDNTGQYREIVTGNEREHNYYWQIVNTTNSLADYLWNKQRLFLDPGRGVQNAREFRIWPDLLIVGQSEGVQHMLPLRPENGYGQWWFSTREWLDHVRNWAPRVGIGLTGNEISRLARVLELPLIQDEARPEAPAPEADGALAALFARLEDKIDGLARGVDGLSREVETLRRELTASKRRIS
jgi:hypothetical protein